MCDPVSLGVTAASMALSGAGSYMNAQEDKANQARMMEAKRNTLLAEQTRQKAFQDEMTPLSEEQLKNLSPDQQKEALASLQEQRASDTAAVVDPVGSYSPPLSSAPKIVNDELGRKFRQATEKQQKEGAALGRLRAWGNLNQNNQLGLKNTANKMTTVGNFSQGSLNLLPLETQANMINAIKAKSGIGDLLGLIGKGVGFAGSLGGFDNVGSLFGSGSGGFIPGGMSVAGAYGPMSNMGGPF